MTAPPVSVVIPVLNEVDAIGHAIESATGQAYDGDLEVVVADGMSTDGTRDVVTDLARRDARIRMVDNPTRRTPSGLNAAIAAAKGDIIVRCDAHAVLPDGYVARAVSQLAETGAANVGGIQRAVGDTTRRRAIARAMSSPLGVGDARFRYGGRPGPVDTVYLGTFTRNALVEVGCFDEQLARNQDYELNHRLRDAGHVVWFDPELVVDYTPRGTLSGLWRQYFDYGVGKRRMLRRHPASLRWRQLAAPALVVGLAGSGVAAAVGAASGALIVPTVYVAALVAGTAHEVVREPSLSAMVFPAAVATMHLAWGLGFLADSVGIAPGPDVR